MSRLVQPEGEEDGRFVKPSPRPQVRALVPGDEIVVELPCRVVVTQITEPGDGGLTVGNMALDYTDAEVINAAGRIRIGERVSVEHVGHHEP